MSLVEHFAKEYLIEPIGVYPHSVQHDPSWVRKTRIVCMECHGVADRIVFRRNGIMVAYTFNEVQTQGSDLTIEVNLP